MMIYKTTGEKPILTAFLAELRIQILIAKKAYDTLYNLHLYALGNRSAKTCSPIETIIECALFLNSAAMINKILGLSERYNKNRAQNLRAMMKLEEGKFQELRLVDLRNSMEHIDERLDLLDKESPTEIVVWNLTKNPSTAKHVLRRFNPEEFTMQCIGKNLDMHFLDVKKCHEEIQYIELAIEIGTQNLFSQKTA